MYLSLIFLTFLGVVKIDAHYWDWSRTQVYIYKKGFRLPWHSKASLHDIMYTGEE